MHLFPVLLSAAAALGTFPKGSGTLVICNQQEDNVYLASLVDGHIAKKIVVGVGPHETAVSPNGKLIAVSNYGNKEPGKSITIIELPAGDVVKTIDLGEYKRPHGIAWLANDRLICTNEMPGNVVLVEVDHGKVEKAIPTAGKLSHMLALSPDKKRVYTANVITKNVSAIDLPSGKLLWQAPAEEGSEGIGISPDGMQVWTANREKNSVTMIETASGTVLKNVSCPGTPYRVQFTPDGKYALVPCPSAGELAVFDAKSGAVVKRIPVNRGSEKFQAANGDPNPGPVGITVNPNGRFAYCAVFWSFAAAVVDLRSMSVVGKIEAGKSPDGIAVSPITVSG